MVKIDRRITKSQEAIKNALVTLIIEKNLDHITIQEISDRANVSRRTIYLHYVDKFDLLDQLIEEHMNELRKRCELAANANVYVDTVLLWFEYFESHYSFFSKMLAHQGGSLFRVRFLDFVLQELRQVEQISEGDNQALSKEENVVFVQFYGSAIVGVVEWWFQSENPPSPQDMARRVGALLERNLSLMLGGGD